MSLCNNIFDTYSRKGSPLVTPSRDETSVHSSSNQTDKDVDTVSLVMKLLASKDGVVLRRLLMAAVSYNICGLIQHALFPREMVFTLCSLL